MWKIFEGEIYRRSVTFHGDILSQNAKPLIHAGGPKKIMCGSQTVEFVQLTFSPLKVYTVPPYSMPTEVKR